MYKLDKTISKAQTFEQAEKEKLFSKDTPLDERLYQSWYLTCMAYGIDPKNPPKMDKKFYTTRKHPL
jgi:predicted metal-binding protein